MARRHQVGASTLNATPKLDAMAKDSQADNPAPCKPKNTAQAHAQANKAGKGQRATTDRMETSVRLSGW
jgi:hypothetical protein